MNFTKKAVAGLATATAAVLLAAPPVHAAPSDVTTGYVVVDADSGETKAKANEHQKFRSASLVKLLIAIDYLENLDGEAIPDEDRALLEPMLRSSNDDAASVFWVRGGQQEIIERMVSKIGLTDTAPPPAEQPGVWGYTAVSAADVAKVYQYILDDAAPEVRKFMLTNLRAHTQCAGDGFDQSFGIPSAVEEPGAVKQGWSGFGEGPEPGEECEDSSDPAMTARVMASPEVQEARRIAPAEAPLTARAATDIDLKRRAMHTTGTVDDDDKIIVLLTLEPEETSWEQAAKTTTALTKLLDRTTN
ncbi:hypothetical protein ABT324_06755 [Saccharopolyspora sp. NPDC000359]|uniref:hypothetical protein n=1 Tax=Saccharopolyspora sp. NPDC000359 TaxID=3154251 RepID=UPI00332334C5